MDFFRKNLIQAASPIGLAYLNQWVTYDEGCTHANMLKPHV